MKKLLFIILSIIFINSSEAQEISYFPKTKDGSGLDESKISWYSGKLKGMNEPVLYNSKSKDAVYRFTWIRYGPAAVIGIERHNSIYYIYWKERIYDNKVPYTEKRKIITKEIWDSFQDKLKHIVFWKLTTNDGEKGADGSEWILEGKASDKYHVVDRWSPHSKSAFFQCCYYLIKLTDLKNPQGERY
jgi:hypothetical protein